MKQRYLICADSDGCVIDGMNIKHRKCFGPAVIEEWDAEMHSEAILKYWNEVNLYSETRGINRFRGLSMMLKYMNAQGYIQSETEAFENWTLHSNELSNKSLEAALRQKNDLVMSKALSWSKRVNEKVRRLQSSCKPVFMEAKRALEQIPEQADLAVVSAADRQAVMEEWEYNHILSYVDILLSQENGSKAECLGQLIERGYQTQKIIMLGDSPGDYVAARKAGVLFYPIRVDKENKDWCIFRECILTRFLSGQYTHSDMERLQGNYLKEICT